MYVATRLESADSLRTDNLSDKYETWDTAIRRRRSSDGVLLATHVHKWTVDNFTFPYASIKLT
jgi:hypothetical protein